MSNQVAFFTNSITPRLTYVAELLFEQLLGYTLTLCTNPDEYRQQTGVKINYSTDQQLPGIQIVPDGFLFEKGIKTKNIRLGEDYHGIPSILVNASSQFDPFAASFYLVSRYEEYLDFTRDDHNRFPATASCLVQLGVLDRPLVNEWALALNDVILEHHPESRPNPRKFAYQSTIDIDQAWKYKNKGLLRNTGGWLRDVFKTDWEEVGKRLSVLLGAETDPFYNYEWQHLVHEQYKTHVQYFVQVGKNGEFDKNISFENTDFQLLIKELDARQSAGIHPSYQSNKDTNLIRHELQALANLLGHDVTVSRQHYLMHEMPQTYQRLLDLGIREEHTLGYSTHIGFRAGIAAPFYFYDLENEKTTPLKLIPFCVMDITPLHYDQLTVEEAEQRINELMQQVFKLGGLFVSLWHNESLSESGRWKGWRRVYEYMIKRANEIRD